MGAMFVGQQFLQNVLGYDTLDAGAGDPARGVLHGVDRASLGQARGGARSAVHAPDRLRLLPPRVRHDAAPVERGHLVLGGRPGVRARRRRRRLRGHARLALAHGLGPGGASGHGVGNGGPATRPRRRDHAVDPRRAADRRVRGRGGRRDRRLSERAAGDGQRLGGAHEVVRRAPRPWGSSTRSTRRRSPRPPRRRSSRGPIGRTPRGSSRSSSGPSSCTSSSRRNDDERRLLAEYHVTDTTGAMGATGVATTA